MATRPTALARTNRRRLLAGVQYNLFSRCEMPEIICAVPEDRPLPTFIGSAWRYRGRLAESARALPGFDARAAAASVRLNGFYFLHDLTGNRGGAHLVRALRLRQSESARNRAVRAERVLSSMSCDRDAFGGSPVNIP